MQAWLSGEQLLARRLGLGSELREVGKEKGLPGGLAMNGHQSQTPLAWTCFIYFFSKIDLGDLALFIPFSLLWAVKYWV